MCSNAVTRAALPDWQLVHPSYVDFMARGALDAYAADQEGACVIGPVL